MLTQFLKIIVDNKRLIISTIVSTLVLVAFLTQGSFQTKYIIILLLIPLLGIVLLSTEYMLLISTACLFAFFGYFELLLVNLISIPLLLSYLINRRKIKEKNIYSANPLTVPFALCIISFLPSLYNTASVLKSCQLGLNLVSMIIFIQIIGRSVSNYTIVKKMVALFLFICFLNALDIFHYSFSSNERYFGFAGVVYVDLVCIAALLSFVITLSRIGKKSIPYIFLMIFFITALLITQTRNSMIALVAALIFGTVFYYLNADLFKVKKATIFRIAIIFLCFSVVAAFGLSVVSPAASERFSELFTKDIIKIGSFVDFGQSSLVTRLLIWYTSFNAFLEHPIIGIGAYSFVFSSHIYSTLPTELYKLFVQGCSPHVTYLAIITENGIVGLVGFITFLVFTFKVAFKSFRNSVTMDEKFVSFGILVLLVYVTFSMLMTDAWLWGQCNSMWAIVLGVSIANYNITNKNTKRIVNA